MPRKKAPTAKSQTFQIIDRGLPSQVRVLQLLDAQRMTFRLQWVDPVDRSDDYHRVHDSADSAVTEAERVAVRLRDGLRPHIGRHTKQSVPTPRPTTVLRTLLTVEQDWAREKFKGKPDSLKNARYNLQRYVYLEMPEIDAEGVPTGRPFWLAKFPVEDLREWHIITWERSLAHVVSEKTGRTIAPSTRALALRNLNALLHFAEKKGWLPSGNPAEGFKVDLYDVKPRDSFRNREDFFAMVRKLPTWAKAPAIVLQYTGARYGEGAALSVSAVDTTNCRIYFERTLRKTGELGTPKSVSSQDFVPYHPSLNPVLEAHLEGLANRGPDDPLFPGQRRGQRLNNSSLNRVMKAACEAAGLEVRVTCHGLRHSLASWLHEEGVPIMTIQKILRHKDERTTIGYIKVHEEQRTAAMAGMAPIPAGILG